MDESTRYREELEAAKRASPAQLLFRAARLVNERGIAKLRAKRGNARGRPEIRAGHTAVLPHIDLEGTRITEIARRMNVTKQAVNQLVGDLERMGMVRRLPDPTDGRAKLVRFTARGRRQLLQGLSMLGELEDELAAALGTTRLRRLRMDLAAIVDYLEESA